MKILVEKLNNVTVFCLCVRGVVCLTTFNTHNGLLNISFYQAVMYNAMD